MTVRSFTAFYLNGAIILLIFVNTANSLQCYKCTDVISVTGKWQANQAGHPTCKNLSQVQSQCYASEDVCYKFVLNGPDGSKMTTRSCGTNEFCNGLNSNSSQGPSTECFSCQTDNCNAASSVAITHTLVLMAVTALAYYTYK